MVCLLCSSLFCSVVRCGCSVMVLLGGMLCWCSVVSCFVLGVWVNLVSYLVRCWCILLVVLWVKVMVIICCGLVLVSSVCRMCDISI